MEGAGEGQAISAEMLQSIQSAVGTGGVIGQVQVIETENGPMTVIFMEEGAEGVGETVGGTTLGMEGDIQQGEDVQYTYQVVDDNTFTTTGNLQDSTQQSILATETVTTTDTTFAHDPVVSLQNSTDNSQIAVSDAMQTIVSNPSQIATSDATQIVVTDPSQIAVGDTTQISVSDGTQINENDTYYITETGELVKIDSSLLTNADLQQQETYIQTSTDSFGNQQLILPEVSAVSSSIMQTPVIQSQTLIPETVQSQTIIPETVHSQTIIPDTAHSQTIIPETVYSQTLIPETVHSPSIIPGTTIMTSSQDDVLTAIKLSQNNYSAGASNAINTRPLTTFSKNKPFGSEKSLQTLRDPYVTLQTTIPTQTMVFPKANVKQPVINVRKSTPIARTPIATRTPETVNVRYQQTTGSGLFTYKTVKINPPGEQKTRLTVNTKPPLRTQSLISQSYLGTKKTEQKPQARTHVLSPATTIKYVSKPTSTVVKPVTPRPTMTQVRVQPPGYRTVPIKQSPQIMMKQSQQQELKSATDLLSSAIQEADMKLQEQRISPETTRIVLPTASVNQSRLPTSLLPSRAAGNVATSLIQPAVEAPMKPADQGDFSDSAMLTLVTQALDSGYLAVPSEPSKVSEITTSSTVVQSTVEAIPKDINQLLDEPPAVAVPVSEFLADNLAMDIDEQSAVQKTTELENEDAAHATKSGDKPASESEKKDEQKAETKTAKISMVVASTSKEDLPVAMETDEPTTSATQTPAPEPGTSNSPATKFKTIDVPDSDVTIELYADGTLVTKDKSGTNYSRVKLEDLGLNKEMLSGNTDIELLIVQGDGKEVRACINTSILENAEPSDNPESDSNNKQTATVVEGGIHNVPKESLTGNALRPYKCSMCPRTFKFYRTFRCHEVVHTKEVTYTCHMCKRVFARETNLASHLELHQKKAAMGITEVKEKLSKDKKKVLKEPKLEMKEWKCGDCDEVFIEHKELKYHRRKVHCSKGPKQICPHCDKTFSTESAFQKHTSVHTGPFVCPVCHERNEEIVDHMKHMGDKHPDKTLTCTICDKVVLSKPDLYQHVTVRHEKEPEEKLQSMYDLLYQECQICQEKFLKKNDLANHMDTVHEEEKSEVCFFCDKSFIKKAQLNTHIGMQHKTMAVYECRKCLEDVAKKDLYNHGKVQHLPPYNCNECKTEYASRNEMEQHQFEEHDGGFSCKKCDVKFTYSHELRTHYKNHEPGSQPFLCDECGEGFEIKPLLKTHVLQQHFKNNHSEMLKHHPEMSGVNNAITCLICGEFNFDFKMVFAKHMRDDHFNGDLELAYTVFPWLKANFPPPGDPPTCDTCGREFLTLPALKAHMKDHEPSKTYSKKPAATPKKAASDEENEYEEEQVDFTHIEPRDTEKAHKCEFCDESFTRKVSLKKHIKSRHKKGTTKAAIGKLEEREEEIENELENELTEDVAETIDSEVSKSPRKKVKLNFCQICEEMFKTMEELISHVKSVHEDNDDKPEDLEVNPVSYDLEKKACLLCSTPSNMKNFFSRYGVRRHMRNCHGITIEDDDSVDTPKSSEKKKKPAKDKISTSLFNKKDTPKSQLKKPKSKKPLGKGAMNISINTDMDSTADEMDYEETNDISAFLGKNFNLGKAVQGMISDEMERDARECKECNESFSCLDTLKKHKILHEMKKNPYLKLDEEILGKIYACKQCKNMYSNALSLIHHNRSKHDGDHEEEILSYVDEVDGILKKIKEIQEQNKGKTSKAKKRKMSLPESDASSRAKKREKLDIATEPESMTSPPQFSKTGRRITKSRKLVEQFSCYKCNKSFDMERSLKNHIKLAHDAKESPIKAPSSPVSGYECSKCNRVFDEMVNLRRHTLMKHKERWEATGLKSENSASAQVSTSTMIYECDVCNQKFSVLSALRHHMISVHDEDDEGDVKVKEEALACTICSQEFASQHTLKIHMRKHTGEKPHTCCVCSNSFISKFKLHLHLKKIHAKLWMKKVHCKTCFALFDNEKAMLKHKDEHNRRDEEEDISDSGSLQHKCKECDKSFKWKKNLDSHMKFFHEETSTKTCGVCNKVFPNNKLIEEHMKTHSNNCNYCGKHYTSENVLKTHESQCRSKKTSEGKMTCDICKKNFSSKAKLLEHMLNHTSIKSAKCDHCLESFKDESSLKSHKCKAKKTTKQSGTKTESKKDKLPTNKKGLKKMPSKFACGKCGKKFSMLYQVRDHKRLVHKISVSDKSSSIQTRRSSAEAESTSKYGMRTASERKASAGNQDTDDNVKTTSKQNTPSTPQASSSEMKTSSKNVTSSSKLTPKPSGVKTPKTSGTPQQKGSSKAAGKTPKPIGKATLTPKGTGQGTKSKKEAQTVTSSSSKSIEKSGEEVHKVAVCPICSKTLKMKRYLRDHLKNVHKIASEKINETIEKAKTKRVKCLYCRECHKMFWSNSLYEEHIRQMHPDKAALELDKQVMEQLIKTEVRSPPIPTLMEGDASDVQYKCEFCTSIMWTKDSFDDHIIEFHPEHVVEYGIPQEALSKSMDENSDEDPSNTLDVEVYQGLTCEQLSTQPVVRLQKMPASPSKKAQNLEVKEKGEDMGAEEHAGKGIEKLTKGQDASSEDSNGSVNDTDIQKESNRTSENENSSDTKTMTECDKEQTYDVDEIQRQAMETEMPAVDYYEFESNKDGEINTSTVSTENATPDAGTDTCEKSVTSPDKDTPQLPDDGDSQQEGQKDVTLKKECPESDDVEHVDSKEDDSEPCIDDVKKDDEITTDSPVDKNIFAVDQTTTNSTSEVGHDSIEQTKDKGNDEDVNQEYEAEKGDMVSVEINKEAMENGSPILDLFVKTESEIRPDIVDDMSIVPNFGQYSEITDLPISGGQETGQTDEGNQGDPIIEPALQKPDPPVTESEQPSVVSIEEDIPAQYGGTVGVAETNKMNVLDSLESAGVNYNSFEQHVEYKAVSEQDTGRINEQNDVNIPHNETQGTDIQGVLTGELSDYEPMDFE